MSCYGEISKIEIIHNGVNVNIKSEIERAFKFSENEWFIHCISSSTNPIVFDNTGNVYVILTEIINGICNIKVADFFTGTFRTLFDHTKSEWLYLDKTPSNYRFNEELIDIIKTISNESNIKVIVKFVKKLIKLAELNDKNNLTIEELNKTNIEKDKKIQGLSEQLKVTENKNFSLENDVKFRELKIEHKNEMIGLLKEVLFKI